jgi:hypothetical protein
MATKEQITVPIEPALRDEIAISCSRLLPINARKISPHFNAAQPPVAECTLAQERRSRAGMA